MSVIDHTTEIVAEPDFAPVANPHRWRISEHGCGLTEEELMQGYAPPSRVGQIARRAPAPVPVT